MRSPADAWPPEAMATLARLWAEGVPTREIGHRLGKSKSAICGKRRRMDLPERGSPIQRPTCLHPEPREPSEAHRFAVIQEPLRLNPLAPPEGTYRHDAPISLPASDGCQWPIGDPMKQGFRFCDSPRVRYLDGAKTPYCAIHYAKAYSRRLEIKEGSHES